MTTSMALFRHAEAVGVNGGGYVAGTQVLPFTELTTLGSDITLASGSRLNAKAGTYIHDLRHVIVAHASNNTEMTVRINYFDGVVTAAKNLVSITLVAQDRTIVGGKVVIVLPADGWFEPILSIQQTRATNGLGIAADNGIQEVYGDWRLDKVA